MWCLLLTIDGFEMAQFSVVGSQATVNVHTPNCDRGVKWQVLVTLLTAAAPTIQRQAMESSYTAQSTGMISKLLITVFSRSNKSLKCSRCIISVHKQLFHVSN